MGRFIKEKELVAATLVRDNCDCIFDIIKSTGNLFDFSELNPDTMKLHLRIDPANYLDLTVTSETSKITCSIRSRNEARRKPRRSFYEGFGSLSSSM